MVKVLSRDAVQRMTGRRSSTTSVVGGGGDSGVSQAWVEENYISKNFFNQLFTIHGTRTYTDEETEEEVTENVVITPNTIPDGEEYKLSNVEVSIGLWTQQFLSALGLNSGGGGGGGASALDDLVDVTISNPQNGQALVYAYDSVTGKGNWVNGNVTPDLSDYATKTWVEQKNYVTSAALTGYATQQWVQQQNYLTSHQSVDGTFWGQSWNNHVSVTGNMTGVGSITMSGDIFMDNGMAIRFKSSGGSYMNVLTVNSANTLAVGYNVRTNGYTTDIQGNTIQFAVGQSARIEAGTFTELGQLWIRQGDQGLRIGDAHLVYDSENSVLKAVKDDGTPLNFYATGGVSALGLSAGASQVDAMTFNHLSVKNSMTFSGSVNIVTGTSSHIVRNSGDSDCIYLMNSYASSKLNNRQYYYNQYDNVGLHGTDYNYSDTWSIDPDGCARFRRVYLLSNTYIHTNGSDLLLTIGSTMYKLTKTTE